MGEIVAANDQNFEALVQESVPLIVDFWSPRCAPCKLMEPGLEKIAQDWLHKVMVVKVNVDDSPKTSSRYFVRTLPTLLFIKGGQVKTQLVGSVNPKRIEQVIGEVF